MFRYVYRPALAQTEGEKRLDLMRWKLLGLRGVQDLLGSTTAKEANDGKSSEAPRTEEGGQG